MWWEHLQLEIALEFRRLSQGRQGILTALSVANPVDVGVRRSLAGRWYITPHAVTQYIQRVKRCTRVEAMADLCAISQRAYYVKQAKGDVELWRSRGTPRLRLYVGPGEGSLPALLTVLGEHDATATKSTD